MKLTKTNLIGVNPVMITIHHTTSFGYIERSFINVKIKRANIKYELLNHQRKFHDDQERKIDSIASRSNNNTMISRTAPYKSIAKLHSS